jgi:hypothetical protein
MAKLLRMQKRLVLLLVSFLLTAAYRTMGLGRSSLADRASHKVARVTRGLLVALSPGLRSSPASLHGSYYAVELNGWFPFVHLHEVPSSASSASQPFPNKALEINDVLGITVFSLSSPATAGSGDPQSSSQGPLGVAAPDFCNPGCLSCTDCTSCTD